MFSCCCSNKSNTSLLYESEDTLSEDTLLVGNLEKPSQQAKPSLHAEKCYRVAMQCLRENNLREALDNFREADKAGYPKVFVEVYKVTYLLGMQLKENHNYKNAFGMFEEAAAGTNGPVNDGLPEAQFELGMCYLTGQGIEQNKDQARIWLTHAANNGNHLAPITLNIMSTDPSKGIKLEIGDNGVNVWN